MDLSQQLENHEQRCGFGSTGTLKMTMPGNQALNVGEQHIVGHLPVGALVDGFQVWINPDNLFGGDVVVDLGIPSNPTLFFSGATVTDGGAIHNASVDPVEIYATNEPLVATITPAGSNPGGIINFDVRYTEVNTKAGKYTY